MEPNRSLPYFERTAHAAPLAVFRIAFGLLIFAGVVRFWCKGWIEQLYISPKYFFPFYGFEFVVPLGNYTYLLFIVCGISALLVALGFFYRLASVALFFSFTYIELMDKTPYLNHYYFISMMCLLLVFLPAQAYFSVHAFRNKQICCDYVPAWCIDAIKLLVTLLYFFAGLAKIHSDWLLEALPLKIWLGAQSHLPFIGPLMGYKATAYIFSWFGMAYDLCIGFLLWNRKVRPWAYATVLVFHSLTALLFPIGMFPYIMMVVALIYFSANFHARLLQKLTQYLPVSNGFMDPGRTLVLSPRIDVPVRCFLALFFAVQVLLPFRYLLYPGELLWTEEGFRFSWRVMLMEKNGHAEFTVKNASGRTVLVNNKDFLSPFQEKMMATQPDMILQYAHILRSYYKAQGFHQPEVYAETYVSLNGRRGQPLVDPKTDLAKENDGWQHKKWILPFSK